MREATSVIVPKQTTPIVNGRDVVNWHLTRRAIREWVLPRAVLRSGLDPRAQELLATLWNLFAAACYAPFPFVTGELEKFNWKPRSVNRWFQIIYDQKWIELLPTDEALGKGFEHLRQFQFTDRIFPPVDNKNRQLLLFEKESFAPPVFLGRLHDLTKVIAPTLLLMDSRIPAGLTIPAWYYDLDGDWESKITRIRIDEFADLFGRDQKRFRELKRTMKTLGYWREVGSGSGFIDIQRCKAFHLPQQKRILAAMADFDPSLVTQLLPMVASTPHDVPLATVVIPAAVFPGIAAAVSATTSAAPSPPADSPAADSVTKSAAPSPPTDRAEAVSATKSAAPSRMADRAEAVSVTTSAAPSESEKTQSDRITMQHAANTEYLRRLAESDTVRHAVCDFKIFENQKSEDLPCADQTNIEDPKISPDDISRTEHAIFKGLVNPSGLYPWFVFLIAAMVNGYKAQWYLRESDDADDRPLPEISFSERDLASIIDWARNTPPNQRAFAFIGACKRRVLEVAGFSRDESAELKDNLQSPAIPMLRNFARQIGYPWPSERTMRDAY